MLNLVALEKPEEEASLLHNIKKLKNISIQIKYEKFKNIYTVI